MNRPPWFLSVVLVVVGCLVALRWLAPPGLSSAPDNAFSGARALAALGRVLGEVPHPVGTPENRAVEERIQAELHRIGLRADVETGVICAEHCARIRNLLVELPGRELVQPVLVSTHYDSVASGPGAGDAGAAVGVMLELARLLHDHPLRRPVHLLFNEGEEAGMLGAQLYLQQPRNIGAVINLEARGTGGNAFLFEFKGASLPWVRRYAPFAPHPSVSSLYTALYDLLPNNTDATIYGQHGLPVANVAFLGGGGQYHTPNDDLHHLDPASVQHLGEQALALLHGLESGDLGDLQGDEPGVFWDLGWLTLRFPRVHFQFGAALLFLGLFLQVGWKLKQGRLPLRSLVLGLACSTGLPVVGIAIGTAAEALRHGLGVQWLGAPVVPLLFLLSAVVGLALQLSPVISRLGPMAWSGVGLTLAVLGMITTWILPEGSYLLVQACAAVLLAQRLPERTWTPWARALFGLAGALPLLHLSLGLVPAIGLIGPLVTGSFAIALLPMLPLFHDAPPWARWGSVGVALVLLVFSLASPATTSERPTGLIAIHLTEGNEASLHGTPLRFPYPPGTTPWPDQPSIESKRRLGTYSVRAQPSERAPLQLELLSTQRGGRRVRVSAPGAVGMYLNGAQVSVEGATDDPFRWVGSPDGLELLIQGDGPLWMAAIYPGLPASVPPLPPYTVPIHTGYQTWIATTHTWSE